MSITKISKKKLKAIVFTDIVNFAKISAEDEHYALELINKQRELLSPIVKNYNGEWLKEIGDGLLFCFDSSLEAVRCSIEIQTILKKIEDFDLRIGIHQGDILITDGDVYGDDVNIASRVESFSPVGGIAISDKISKDISGVNDIKTSFIGYRKLKGVKQETQIRCITSHLLPKQKINLLPRVTYYCSLVFGSFLILGSIILGIAIYSHDGLSGFNDEVPGITALDHLIGFAIKGIIFILLGYNCLGYTNGVSQQSQRTILYFTYIYSAYYFIDEFLMGVVEGKEGGFYIASALVICAIIVSSVLKITKSKE